MSVEEKPHVNDNPKGDNQDQPNTNILDDARSRALSEALHSSFKIIRIFMVILVLAFIGSGITKVNENEQALLLRFGVYKEPPLKPGLNFAWPYPIDEIVKIEVEEQRTIESDVGWITAEGEDPQDSFSFAPDYDGYAITGDGNTVHIKASMTYSLPDTAIDDYEFKFKGVSDFIRSALDNAVYHAAASHSALDAITLPDKIKEAISYRVKEVISAAIDNDIPIRVGVNAGSLEKDLQKKYGEPNADALVESALRHVDILDKFNFENYKMSLKASNIEMTVEAYRKISNIIDQPLHLGITEAGSYRAGTVKSSIGVGMLLSEGIGDTIRISLASDPVDEIKIGWDILKSLNIRSRGVKIVACPSCSRQNFNVIEVVNELEQRLEDISDDIEVAIIGCYVNGPGESKAATIGLTGASPNNLLYVDGTPNKKISNEDLVDELEEQVRSKISKQKIESEKIILRS